MGVRLGGDFGTTVDALDQACCNIFNVKTYTFTPSVASFNVRFEFLIANAGSVIRIDQVSIT